jgi:hypothetical protein
MTREAKDERRIIAWTGDEEVSAAKERKKRYCIKDHTMD